MVEFHHLCCNLFNGYPVWGGGVNRFFVTPLHPYPRHFDKRWVRSKKGINGIPRLLRPALAVLLEDFLDPESKSPHIYLYPVRLRRNYFIDKSPGLWLDPPLEYTFPPWGIGYLPTEFGK